MTLQFWFWIIYVLALFFSWFGYYEKGQVYPWPRFGGGFVLWLLIGILGWHNFGGPVK
jgi:hypothetical protein